MACDLYSPPIVGNHISKSFDFYYPFTTQSPKIIWFIYMLDLHLNKEVERIPEETEC